MSARLLEVLAYNLYKMTLVGNPAPMVKDLGERMIAPEVGDLVLETSTIYYEDRAGTRMGRLARITEEPMHTAEVWADGGDAGKPIPTERVWYLDLPDGREFPWVNASFIAVPTEIVRYDVPFVSDPTALAGSPTGAPR